VFECIYRHCNWIHHHFLIVTFLPCTPNYIFFSLNTMTPFPTCYTTTFLFFHSHDPFQLSYNLSLFFTSIHHRTFHIPHSKSSLVARSIAEPKFKFFFPQRYYIVPPSSKIAKLHSCFWHRKSLPELPKNPFWDFGPLGVKMEFNFSN
jgi:hypothetical protein